MQLYRLLKSPGKSAFLSCLSEFTALWKEIAICVQANSGRIARSYASKAKNFGWLASETGNLKHLTLLTRSTHEIFNRELLLRLKNKLSRMGKIKAKKNISHADIVANIESAIKAAVYNYARHLLNDCRNELSKELYGAIYFFVRDMAYSGMFRYNSGGKFNVPYGGIGYNRKDFKSKINYLGSAFLKQKLSKTSMICGDFEAFFSRYSPSENDFVFLDPPYDTEFSSYSGNSFSREDHKRLSAYLIHTCKARWMLVIKKTDFISSLYNGHNLDITTFDKTYQVSFKNRNNRKSTHLLIRNYNDLLK